MQYRISDILHIVVIIILTRERDCFDSSRLIVIYKKASPLEKTRYCFVTFEDLFLCENYFVDRVPYIFNNFALIVTFRFEAI